MQEIVAAYYAWLSGLANALAAPIGDLAATLNVPLLSAFLFGLIGATSPCQLSTNVAALGFLARKATDSRRVWSQTAAFVVGKITVYTVVGATVVALGLQISQFSQTAVPIVVFARRALGPLLILVGLIMVGLLRPRLEIGGRLSASLQARVARRRGLIPAYLLGVAFSFTFCPTLFWLFFGLTIPLALASDGGLLVPASFAFGVTLPVTALVTVLALGRFDVGRIIRRFKTADAWIQRGVGFLFMVIGLHEIALYWLL